MQVTARTDREHEADGPRSRALAGVRICDLTGLLAGAGATRFLAAFGAQVIRVEQPLHQPRWDFLRGGIDPDGQFGINLGTNFNNHNVEKLSITLDLSCEEGQALLARLVAESDVVTENFSAHVLERFGFDYERFRSIKPDIVYVSNSGYGKTGPYSNFKSIGQIVQACSGLTFASGYPELPPAGWGFAYMDHMGAYFMAMAVLAGLIHRNRTGDGQWIDFACIPAGIGLAGPDLLDAMVNARPMRRPGKPNSSADNFPAMAPHAVYPAAGDDEWVAIACRDDADWERARDAIGEGWARDDALAHFSERFARRTELDAQLAQWTAARQANEIVRILRAADVPVAEVATPEHRIDHDPSTAAWGLWPWVHHEELGDTRVEGIPLHLSDTDWVIRRAGPCLGVDNDYVYGTLLGLSDDERADLADRNVI